MGSSVRSAVPAFWPSTSRIARSCSDIIELVITTPLGVPVAPEVKAMRAASRARREPSFLKTGSGTGAIGALANRLKYPSEYPRENAHSEAVT